MYEFDMGMLGLLYKVNVRGAAHRGIHRFRNFEEAFMDYLSRLLALRHPVSPFALVLFSTLTLAGCEIIGDIFKAGVWVGVLLVIGVIALVVWLLTRSA